MRPRVVCALVVVVSLRPAHAGERRVRAVIGESAEVTMAGAVWIAALGRPGRSECLLPIAGLGTVFLAVFCVPELASSLNNGFTPSPDEVGQAAVSLLPGLIVLLAGAPAARPRSCGGSRVVPGGEASRMIEAQVLAALGLKVVPGSLPESAARQLAECRELMLHAHAHAEARRLDPALADLTRLDREALRLPSHPQPEVVAAADCVRGLALERGGRKAEAVQAYRRALEEIPGPAHAVRALERIGDGR